MRSTAGHLTIKHQAGKTGLCAFAAFAHGTMLPGLTKELKARSVQPAIVRGLQYGWLEGVGMYIVFALINYRFASVPQMTVEDSWIHTACVGFFATFTLAFVRDRNWGAVFAMSTAGIAMVAGRWL